MEDWRIGGLEDWGVGQGAGNRVLQRPRYRQATGYYRIIQRTTTPQDQGTGRLLLPRTKVQAGYKVLQSTTENYYSNKKPPARNQRYYYYRVLLLQGTRVL